MVEFQIGVGFQLDMDIQIVQLDIYDATIAVIFQLKGEFQPGVIFQLSVIFQLGYGFCRSNTVYQGMEMLPGVII